MGQVSNLLLPPRPRQPSPRHTHPTHNAVLNLGTDLRKQLQQLIEAVVRLALSHRTKWHNRSSKSGRTANHGAVGHVTTTAPTTSP